MVIRWMSLRPVLRMSAVVAVVLSLSAGYRPASAQIPDSSTDSGSSSDQTSPSGASSSDQSSGSSPSGSDQTPGSGAGPAASSPASSSSPSSGATGGFWMPGAGAALANTYQGNIDSPGNGATVPPGFTVAGWAVDTTANGWAGFDKVQLLGSGGTVIASGIVGIPRTDVARTLGNPSFTNSGWYVVVPASANLSGAVTLTVAMHTPGKGTWTHPLSLTVSGTGSPAPASAGGATAASGNFGNDPLLVIQQPTAGATAGINSQITVSGFAVDRNAASGTGVSSVQVYLNEEKGSPKAMFLGNANLNQASGSGANFGPQFANSGFTLTVNASSNLPPGGANVYVYASSSVSGKVTEAEQSFELVCCNR